MGNKIAFIFPGQGSQYVGMGKDLYEKYFHLGSPVFDICEKITEVPVRTYCFEGPLEELTRTEILQPALTAVEIMIANILMENGIKPDVLAGHSLGEYPALNVCGVLNLGDTFKLVKERGRLMEEECKTREGGMVAVIGMGIDKINEILEEFKDRGVIVTANHNSLEQIIVTGEKSLVEEFTKVIKERGAKAIPLKVSGAFHSPLMEGAKVKFEKILQDTTFYRPIFNFFSNVTGKKVDEPAQIRELMAEQIISPVLWVKEVEEMIKFGVTTFVEVGPKQVLTNLIKKCGISDNIRLFSVEDVCGLERCLKELRD